MDEHTVKPGIVFLACITTAALSGIIALRFSSSDQGRVLTLGDMRGHLNAEILRLKTSPTLPPQARGFAIALMEEDLQRIDAWQRSHK